MQSKNIKILISLILIVALCLAVTITPSYAITTPIVVGGVALAVGGLAWAISNAMGVDFSLANYAQSAVGDAFNPFYTAQTSLLTSDFTFLTAVRAGYDALQMSVAAYNAIKAGSENVINDNAITDNSTGTITYSGTVNGLPYYADGNYYRTDTFSGIQSDTTLGSFSIVRVPYSSSASNQYFYYKTYNERSDKSFVGPVSIWFRTAYRNNTEYWIMYIHGRTSTASSATETGQTSAFQPVVTQDSVNLPYQSDIVNTNYGSDATNNVTVFIPQGHGLTDQSTLQEIADVLNELAKQGSSDVTLQTDYTPDPPSPVPTTPLGEVPFDEWQDLYGQHVTGELENVNQGLQTVSDGIDDLINVGNGGNQQNNQNWHDFRSDFAVTAAVIAAIWNWLQNTLNRSITEIERIVSTISSSITQGISDVITGIQTQTSSITQAISDVITQIKTAIQNGVTSITSTITSIGQDIITSISTGVSNIVSGITSSITSAVTSLGDIISGGFQDIIADIEKAGIELFDKALKSIKRIFMPILLLIKQGLGIWHYVVTWFNNISAPFTWTLGMMAGTSAIMLSPIYACIAGALVIAVYKRFGR